MGSLLLIVGLGLWLIFVCFLAIWIAGKLPETWRRAPVTIIVFLALLPMPLADEFLAIPEFKQLCAQHTTVQVNEAKARGRTVHQAQDVFVEVKGTWVLTRGHQRRFAGMDFDTALSGLAKGNFTTAELLKFMEGVSGAVEGATANSKYALYSESGSEPTSLHRLGRGGLTGEHLQCSHVYDD